MRSILAPSQWNATESGEGDGRGAGRCNVQDVVKIKDQFWLEIRLTHRIELIVGLLWCCCVGASEGIPPGRGG
jgi:hypothetical protein